MRTFGCQPIHDTLASMAFVVNIGLVSSFHPLGLLLYLGPGLNGRGYRGRARSVQGFLRLESGTKRALGHATRHSGTRALVTIRVGSMIETFC